MRVRMLQQTFGERLQTEWRAFLLRPQPQPRTLEQFRDYTRSWLRVAEDKPGGEFRPWSTDEGPPTHSLPPHMVAKAAAEFGDAAFHKIHDALLRAYFTDNRDITARAVLQSIWAEAGLPPDAFDRCLNRQHLEQIMQEHNEAIACGASGAPSFRMAHHDVAITGLHPPATLERWIQRALDDRI